MSEGIKYATSQLNKTAELSQKLDAQFEKLKATIEATFGTDVANKFAKDLEQGAALSRLKTNIDSVKSGFAGLGNEISKTFSQLRTIATLGGLTYAVKSLWNAAKTFTNASVDFVEVQNLFDVSMGNGVKELADNYQRALDFQDELSEKLSINIAESMKYQALFNSMSRSMGLTSDAANLLSENFTKLGYDLASLYNISSDAAMDKLRAGLSGQTKPLRDIGLDITQQSLTPISQELGIDRSVKNMSQAEKMILRYIAVLRQASLAHGDFAKTMDTPANQMRIFNSQIQIMQRNIGNLWQGLLGKVLPYVNAVVMVINELLKMLGKLFGFSVSGFSGVNIASAIGADDAEADLGGATAAAKELKKQLMGFDEIHNIELPDASSGGGGGGGGGVGGIDQRLLDAMKGYDNLMDKVKNKATEIRDKIMDWLGFHQVINEETGELEWKLKQGIYPRILKIRDAIVKAIAVFAGIKAFNLVRNIATIGKNIAGIFKDTDGNLTTVGKGFKNFFTTTTTSTKGLGETVSTTAMSTAGAVTAAIAGVVAYFALNYKTSSAFRDGIKIYFESLKDTLEKIGKTIGDITTKIKEKIVDVIPEGVKEAFNDNIVEPIKKAEPEFKEIYDAFGGWKGILADIIMIGNPFGKMSIGLKTLGYLNQPIIKDFDVLNQEMVDNGDISQETYNKLSPLMSGFENLDKKLRQIDYSNIVPSESDISAVANNLKTMVELIGSGIEEAKQKAMDSINELSSAGYLTDEQASNILTKTNELYDKQKQSAEEAKNKIVEIYQNASNEHRALTDAEVQEIQRLQSQMKENAIKTMTESEKELENIQNRVTATATQQSALQASEIIKAAKEAKDGAYTEAEGRYQQQLKIAQQLRAEGGEENERMADEIIAAAERQKQDTMAAADEQFANIIQTYREKNPEILELVDENTGEIRGKIDILKDIIRKKVNEIFGGIMEKLAPRTKTYQQSFV